ncbi:MAG TPA: hypothetical protein PKI61_03510 [bacterium]|nr:hypothetical protein [bacterium]HPT29582.1 hypothetical protein [bacterium]
MEFQQLFKRKKGTLITWILIFLLIGGLVTFSQTFKYGAKSRLLVIQEGASGVDPFAVSRSVEYLSSLLSEVTYSNSFYNMVLDSGFNIDRSYFQGDSIKQLKTWQNTVSARGMADSGFINITIYHPSSYQAKQIALAVNNVLMTQNSVYQGIGSSVKVTVVDEPLVSRYPTQPNLPINFGLSLVLGLAIGFIYIYLFPEEKYDMNLFRRKGKKRQARNLETNFLPQQNQAGREGGYEEDDISENDENFDIEGQGNIRNILK